LKYTEENRHSMLQISVSVRHTFVEQNILCCLHTIILAPKLQVFHNSIAIGHGN